MEEDDGDEETHENSLTQQSEPNNLNLSETSVLISNDLRQGSAVMMPKKGTKVKSSINNSNIVVEEN